MFTFKKIKVWLEILFYYKNVIVYGCQHFQRNTKIATFMETKIFQIFRPRGGMTMVITAGTTTTPVITVTTEITVTTVVT